ncbi:MAG: TIGR04255 family protein [Candidatus Brocadia sp. AMX2]|uniref:TIGR04255 family protein n=1 Tax=Candidatus Brocadia sinica JPN1 TaxID=1197129 RepID=A0ABQ0JV46_9BACT|nr:MULTISPECIES: TIGR04255 family protein [Brocadia]KXK32844.1 MAG: hypothetical protein UZ01_00266 [Candidatus Brocadia sinica]MBC6930902.1 TIGR04255 family protein [Candidatus Brocadia sp.]MBL1167892.1 TIGR04255 family protein [Candidatus Brocadia sp. AMX1]NOG41547.1 TIGR04255 family protein [Planctomycetota bacterium]KAA0245387.1 MAG: TIGR04255 family protein [Candidatus Brocadia sp. AMX2]
MGEILKNPPLVEAVCEFQFDPESKWDWTIPGLLFEKIGGEFSERAEVHRLGVTVQQLSRKITQPSVIESGPERIQLKRSDSSAMVQVGPRQLIINHLRPYKNWDTFCELILRIYSTYLSVIQSGRISRLGLRYVNQIELTEFSSDWKNIISIWPSFPNKLKRDVATFFQRYELKHNKPEGVLIHQTGLIQSDDKSMVVLDLDFISTAVSELVEKDQVAEWLNQAHDRIEESFIDSLTPDAYTWLKEGKK